MAEEKQHAVLSASGAHKWLVCTPSTRLEEKFPNKTSDYMEEGTLAHEIAEFKVRRYFFPQSITKTAYTKGINKFKKRNLFNEEMLAHTDKYVEFIAEESMQTANKPTILVEQKVDFSKYVPEGFGTADCILIYGDTLEIIDFKYGKGVKVEAENNPQMKLYALGALSQFSMIYNIKYVKMSIVQPRLDHIAKYEIPIEPLLEWGGKVVTPLANKAFLGIGDFVQGEHCRFCRAKGACEFRAKENIKVIEDIKEKVGDFENSSFGTLSNEELGKILTETEGLDSWFKDIREFALCLVLKGENVPGWKAVEGKSNRKITDIDKAFEIIESKGFDKAVLYEKKPITLTALEKLVGKTKLNEAIGKYIEKPKGAPTLAKETDKREAYKTSAAEEFKNESEEN